MPLDLITNNHSIKNIRDGIEYQHSDPFNLSLFTDRAVFERVPVLADIDGLPSNLAGYDAIYNRATGQLVDYPASLLRLLIGYLKRGRKRTGQSTFPTLLMM